MSFSWGSPKLEQFWSDDRVAADGYSRETGVVRRVWFGAEYLGPPPAVSGLKAWQQSADNRLEFFMSLGDLEGEPSHSTLLELGDALRGQLDAWAWDRTSSGTTIAWENDLARLDWAVNRLLEVGAALHDARVGVGPVHPENVLVVELDGATRRELVLPDWGFAHNEADNGPDGLKNLADPEWAFLRDEPIGRLNTMIRSRDAAQVGSDVRALARTLACVLLGKNAYIERHKANNGPPLTTFRESKGQLRSSAEIWTVLERAVAGSKDIGSIEVLRNQLRSNPPSGHFVALAEKARKDHESHLRRRRVALLTGLGSALIGFGALVILWGWEVYDVPWSARNPLCPECHSLSSLQSEIAQFAAARPAAGSAATAKQPDEEFQALEAVHKATRAPWSWRQREEEACLAKLRGLYLEDLEPEFRRLKETLDYKSDDEAVEQKAIHALDDQIRRVEKLGGSAETPCPEWINEFRSYVVGRWEPPAYVNIGKTIAK